MEPGNSLDRIQVDLGKTKSHELDQLEGVELQSCLLAVPWICGHNSRSSYRKGVSRIFHRGYSNTKTKCHYEVTVNGIFVNFVLLIIFFI